MSCEIVLASGSPQRLVLLQQIGIEPNVQPADIDETPLDGEPAQQLVARLAEGKAEKIALQLPDAIVIAADSVVAVDGLILGKPRDEADARGMLKSLSGTKQQVFTGHCIIVPGQQGRVQLSEEPAFWVHVERTDVTFRSISEPEIDAYIASGEYKNKAGACSIQGYGSVFVESIDGSYSNVVGLDLGWVARQLSAAGVEYWTSWDVN